MLKLKVQGFITTRVKYDTGQCAKTYMEQIVNKACLCGHLENFVKHSCTIINRILSVCGHYDRTPLIWKKHTI